MKRKIKHTVPYSIRHGDVLLVDAAYRGEMPDHAKEIIGDRVVLAHGEVTGHAHVIDKEKARLWDAKGERFLQIVENLAPLTHEEHSEIKLDRLALVNPASGRLQQAFQVEDFGEEVRRVTD